MAKPTLLLDAHLKALRLPTFLREYDKVARQCAQEGLGCSRYLFRLCETGNSTTRVHRDRRGLMMVFICAIAREFRIGAEPNLRFSLSLGFARRR